MKLTSKQIAMLVVLIVGTFVAVLNQTVVTPALPSVMVEMSADASTAQWLTTGFTLVNAIMIPITAYLLDRYSTRMLFTASMGIFAAGSLLAGIGPNFPVLLIGRLLQAAGAGVLMPMVQTVLMLTFPPERRGSAMGVFGLVIAFAPAVGPSVAGLVIDTYNWHILFYGITVLSAVVLAAGLLVLERTEARNATATLDKLSVVLSTAGFGLLLYGLSTIGSVGVNALDIALTVAGIAVIVLFFVRQLRLETPMLNVRVLANRNFLVGTVIGMLVQAALLAAGVLMPIYLQSYRGFSATLSGLVILPGAVLMGVMGIFVGRMFDKRGPRTLSIVGLGLLSASTLAFAFLGDGTNVALITVLYTVRMFSLALVNMPITTWAMNALDNSLMAHGTSVNNTLRQVAGSLGTAVLVSVSTAASNAASGSMDAVHAGIHGVNMAFAVATGLCVVGFAMAVLLVRNRPGDAAKADPTGERRSVLEPIMKRDVYTLPDTATVCDAVQMLVDKGISAAPVVNAKGEAIGFVSDGDVARFLATHNRTFTDPVSLIMLTASNDQSFGDRLDQLMQMSVTSIGTHHVISVDIHSDLPEVCRVLGDNHLKKVAVTENGQLVGVINRSDITRYSMVKYLESRTGK